MIIKNHLYVLQAIIQLQLMLKAEVKDLHALTAGPGPPADPVRTLNGTMAWDICCECHCAVIYTHRYLVKHLCGKLYFLTVAQDAPVPARFTSQQLVRYNGT